MATKKAAATSKPAQRKPILLGQDVANEQAATRAAWEALRLLSPGGRVRALDWLSSWAREENSGNAEADW